MRFHVDGHRLRRFAQELFRGAVHHRPVDPGDVAGHRPAADSLDPLAQGLRDSPMRLVAPAVRKRGLGDDDMAGPQIIIEPARETEADNGGEFGSREPVERRAQRFDVGAAA